MTDQVSRLDVTATDNVSAAMNAAAASLDKAATAADGVTTSVERAGRSAESYVRQNDAVSKSAAALAKALSDQAAQAKSFADALDQGKGDADAFARATEAMESKVASARARLAEAKATTADLSDATINATSVMEASAAAHSKVASSSGALQASFHNLEIQFSQTVSGLATGQPIFQTLIQQGHQVADEMLATGVSFKDLGTYAASYIGRLLTPMTLVAAAAVAVGVGVYEMTKAGNESLGMLAAVQVGLRGTQDGYASLGQTVVDVARKVSGSSGLGLDEAVKAAQTLASAKYFSGTAKDLEALTRDAENLGAMMGGTATAAKALADGMQDPAKEAEALSATFSRTLTPALLEQISLTQKAGDYNKAYTLLLGGLRSAAGDAARDGLSPIARAWQDLGNAFTGSTAGWRPFIEWLATTAAAAINGITASVKAMSAAWKAVGSIPTTIRSQSSGGILLDNDGMPVGSASGQAENTTTATPTSSATKDAFIANWTDAAKQAGSALGVSPSVLLAQWGMESGWGKSAYNNNVGNIMPGGGYTGSTFTNPGDNKSYRSYADPAAFAADFVAVVEQKWPGVKNTGANASAYAAALRPGQQGGYAEDPDYAAKLTATAAGLDAPGVSAGAVSNQKAMNDELAKTVETSRQFKDLQLAADYTNIQAAMEKEAAANGTGTAAYHALTEAAEKNAAARYANVDALTAAQRASESSLRSTSGMTAAEQSLASAIEARSQVAKTAGQAFTSADEAQAVNNVLAQQSQEYARTTFAMSQASAEQGELATAYGKGNQAVLDTTAKQTAYSEALKLFPRDSAQFGAAFKELIGYYQQAALEAGLAKTAQANLQSRDTLAYIEAETASLGQNEETRTRLLATMQAEQEMHRQFGDILPVEAQQYIALKAATADATSAFQHQQGALQEVSGFFSSTFDTISNAITQAFATGQLQALKFKDVMHSVVSAIIAEFAKLAILNPLKNALFGGNDQTLTSITGVLGKLVGGGTSDALSDATSVFGGAGGVIGAPVGAVGATGVLGSLFGGSGTLSGVVSLVKSVAGAFTDGTSTVASTVGSIASSLGASDALVGTVTSAVGTVASALPYIGAAISVVTSLISGDYKSAALTLAGAAIGTAILPGIGTAIGAAVGSLVSSLLPNHPLHPYSNVDLNIQGGQLTTAGGYDVGQLTDLNSDKAGVQAYADSINTYLKQVGVVITDTDGTLGHIGSGITGFNRGGLTTGQTTDVASLFKNLSFGNDPSDTSTFGVAKGALTGMSFDSPLDLQTELTKIASFADALDALGITLSSVGKDISNIQLSGVNGGDASATSTVQDADGRNITYKSDLKTALNADLPGQTFADTSAVDTEIAKVATFIGATIPQLLTPVKTTSSSLQDQIKVLNQQYANAMTQSKSYGLDNDQVLTDAENRAIAILSKSAIDAVNATMTSINVRYATAVSGTSGSGSATMANLASTQQTERASFEDQWRQTWGDTIVTNQAYINSMNLLIATQNAETVAAQQQATLTRETGAESLTASSLDYAKRAGVTDTSAYALSDYDAKAQVERDTFIKSWTDYYGQAVTSTQAFQSELSLVDAAHYKERIALQQSFVDQYSVADRNAAGQVVTSLTTYAKGLQTSSASPLSTQDQYALASSQFNAVAGAASAGDYGSVQQIQSYADSFLSTSRALNGSSAAYADDFTRVVNALNNVATTSADTLTASYEASIVQGQTDQLVTELQALQAAVVALRIETQQAGAAPARVAA